MFLEGCVGAAPLFRIGAESLPAQAVASSAAEPLTYGYASESWSSLLPNAPLVVGLLITRKPAVHIAAIDKIKRVADYQRRLTHHGTDRRKLHCVRELLHYFARDSELRFVAQVVTAPTPDLLRSQQVRNDAFVRLFAAARVPPRIVLRVSQRPRRETHLTPVFGRAEYLERVDAMKARNLIRRAEEISFPKVAGMRAKQRQPARRDGLVELASLLNGMLFRSRIVPTIYRDSPMRRTIAVRLQTLLAINSLETRRDGKWEPSVVSVSSEGRRTG
jgi:hypothetical protein